MESNYIWVFFCFLNHGVLLNVKLYSLGNVPQTFTVLSCTFCVTCLWLIKCCNMHEPFTILYVLQVLYLLWWRTPLCVRRWSEIFCWTCLCSPALWSCSVWIKSWETTVCYCCSAALPTTPWGKNPSARPTSSTTTWPLETQTLFTSNL